MTVRVSRFHRRFSVTRRVRRERCRALGAPGSMLDLTLLIAGQINRWVGRHGFVPRYEVAYSAMRAYPAASILICKDGRLARGAGGFSLNRPADERQLLAELREVAIESLDTLQEENVEEVWGSWPPMPECRGDLTPMSDPFAATDGDDLIAGYRTKCGDTAILVRLPTRWFSEPSTRLRMRHRRLPILHLGRDDRAMLPF